MTVGLETERGRLRRLKSESQAGEQDRHPRTTSDPNWTLISPTRAEQSRPVAGAPFFSELSLLVCFFLVLQWLLLQLCKRIDQ